MSQDLFLTTRDFDCDTLFFEFIGYCTIQMTQHQQTFKNDHDPEHITYSAWSMIQNIAIQQYLSAQEMTYQGQSLHDPQRIELWREQQLRKTFLQLSINFTHSLDQHYQHPLKFKQQYLLQNETQIACYVTVFQESIQYVNHLIEVVTPK